MDLSAISAHVGSADVPLQELAHNQALTKAQKVAEVTQKFEAVLLEQILQETQKPVFVSEFTDNSAAASIYRGLITEQLAGAISHSGGFGLAKMLDRQLTRQLDTQSKPASKDSTNPPLATPAPLGKQGHGNDSSALSRQFTATPNERPLAKSR